MYTIKAQQRVAVRSGEPGNYTYQLGTVKQRRGGFYHVALDNGDRAKAEEGSLTLMTNNRVVKKTLSETEFQVMFMKKGPPEVKVVASQFVRDFLAQASNYTTITRAKRTTIGTKPEDVINQFKRQVAVYQTSDQKIARDVLRSALSIMDSAKNFNRQSDQQRAQVINMLAAFRVNPLGQRFMTEVTRLSAARTVGVIGSKSVTASDSDGVKYKFPLQLQIGGTGDQLLAFVYVELAEADYPELSLADAQSLVPNIVSGIQNVMLAQSNRLQSTCEATLGCSMFETAPYAVELEAKRGVQVGVRYTLTNKLSIK